ncbi:MAG: hypothetical protein IT372_01105 [Polyangiaceae bacterium]|nr:hypothetical protein [Polyangiaceae bacterium]
MRPDDIALRSRRVGRDTLGSILLALRAAGYFGLMALPHGPAAAGATALIATAVFGGLGVRDTYRKARALAVQALNTSFNLISLGKLLEAEAILRALDSSPRFEWARRLTDIQLAVIAMRRGQLELAAGRLDAAIARPLGWTARDNSLQQIEGAHALRAFVRASLGRREPALEDIAAVRGAASPGKDALARVALAEAMLLERAGRRDDLRALIDRDRDLLLEHTHPRERAIVRAYQRMLRADTGSVYRMAAARDEDPAGREEPPLADWIARIAPGAAPFVRAPRNAGVAAVAAADTLAVPATTPAGRRAAMAARAEARPRRPLPLAALGLTIAIGVVLFPLWLLIKPEAGRAGSGAGGAIITSQWLAAGALAVLGAGVLAALGAAAFLAIRRGRERAGRRMERAPAPAAPREPAERDLRALTESPSDVVAAQAWLLLATAAERRGDMDIVLEHAARGLGRLADARSRAAADILYPDLISLRAFALAARDRFEEADAELAMLGPGYPHHARAVFRVRLVQRLRARDLDGAAEWALRSEGDLPLSVREELLADLAVAASAPERAGAGEAARLRDELRAAPELRLWILRVAPGLLEAFHGGRDPAQGARAPGAAIRIDAAPAPEPDEAAELEAAEALRAIAPRRA